MDLNICLYCEKHLLDDNMNFCSINCQTKEASKPHHNVYPVYSTQSKSSRSPTIYPSYSLYHRPMTFTYNTLSYKPPSLSSSTSTLSNQSCSSSSPTNNIPVSSPVHSIISKHPFHPHYQQHKHVHTTPLSS
ncbi:hypothetical protein BDB01DRAFT_782184 [Pilobolus umbonatus]|nr:hypothetical protein BDB01DRAFT_782184 [Pilobolus umbonatus]